MKIENRQINVPDDKLSFTINKHFNVSYNSPVEFYRAVDSDRYGDRTFINPQKLKRTSSDEDSSNMYYILFDELDSWKGYPSRSKSIIFTNNITETYNYGSNIYKVFPNNKANIAWGHYNGYIQLPYANDMMYIHNTTTVSQILTPIITEVLKADDPDRYEYYDIYDIDDELNSSETAIPLLNKLRSIKLTSTFLQKFHDDNFSSRIRKKYISYYDNYTMYDMIDDLLNPQNNKIKRGNIQDLISDVTSNKGSDFEIWTDGLCYLEHFKNNDSEDNDQI